jgi:hypothetical protein
MQLISKFYLPCFISICLASDSLEVSVPIFLDSTWTTWDNVCNDKNQRLVIGAHCFHSLGSQTFTVANHFCDVFAALGLMLELMLEPFSVSSQDSRVTDSLMKLLKDSSAPNIASPTSSNSFGWVNKFFCHFVIDMLSVQLVFNNWYPFSAQSAPSPYVKETPQEVIDDIAHNQGVLVSLCVQLNPISCMSVFKEGNQLCLQVPTLKKTFSSVVTMKYKLEKGNILSSEGYAENYVSYFLLRVFYYCTMSYHPNVYLNQDHLWIHHWVILQFVNPLFSVPTHHNLREVGPDGFRQFQFKHNNWMQFIRSVDDELGLKHHDRFNESPHFGLVWLGQRVHE